MVTGVSFSLVMKIRFLAHVLAPLQSPHLDRALASGTDPRTTTALELRAGKLTSAPTRRELERTIRRLLEQGGTTPRMRVDPLPDRVRGAAGELSLLASRLAQPGPVSARGVAAAMLLLTDGSGPLYNRHNDEGVGLRAASAATALSALS